MLKEFNNMQNASLVQDGMKEVAVGTGICLMVLKLLLYKDKSLDMTGILQQDKRMTNTQWV